MVKLRQFLATKPRRKKHAKITAFHYFRWSISRKCKVELPSGAESLGRTRWRSIWTNIITLISNTEPKCETEVITNAHDIVLDHEASCSSLAILIYNILV